jgi:hypothetical protein
MELMKPNPLSLEARQLITAARKAKAHPPIKVQTGGNVSTAHSQLLARLAVQCSGRISLVLDGDELVIRAKAPDHHRVLRALATEFEDRTDV